MEMLWAGWGCSSEQSRLQWELILCTEAGVSFYEGSGVFEAGIWTRGEAEVARQSGSTMVWHVMAPMSPN